MSNTEPTNDNNIGLEAHESEKYVIMNDAQFSALIDRLVPMYLAGGADGEKAQAEALALLQQGRTSGMLDFVTAVFAISDALGG